MEDLKVCFCVSVRGAGGGFQKAKKGCGILSGDHPSYESRRLAEVLLYLHSGGNYKSPEVRTSVNRLSCRLNTSCVFRDICSLVFLRLTGVYRVFFRAAVRFVLSGFLLLIEQS